MLKWYEQECEKEQNIIASRVRFARNWNEYVFPSRLSEKDGREMIRRLDEGLTDLSEIDGRYYEAVMLEDLDELERQVLADRRVINRASIKKKGPAELILSAQEDISVLLNGTDHIRIQTIRPGMDLSAALRDADQIDDYVDERFSYAFDEKYGYLTSYPTNVGTGMRASVLIHLPSLSLGKKFQAMLGDMGRFGVSVRGVYGEGRENYGSIYEVSNVKTLGQTERELAELVCKVALQLNDQENQVRQMTLENHRLEREDEVYKSYGVLKYARKLSMKEAMTYLSHLRAGICDGVVALDGACPVYGLILGIQNANLLKIADHPLDKDELDGVRASYIRDHLPDIKQV